MTMGTGATGVLAVMRSNMASAVREAGQAVIRVHPSAMLATLRTRTIGTKVALRAHNPVQTGSGVTMHSRHADARGRMAGTIPLVMPRGRQRVQGNATACVTLHMIVATSVVAGSVTREAGKRAMPMRVRVQVSATSPRPTNTAGIATSASLASSGALP